MEFKSPPTVSEKLKATFALGLSSNFSTLLGLLIIWVFLTRAEWADGFWSRALFVLLLGPTFLADSVNLSLIHI